MADRVVVCAGTKRGLFFLESDRARTRWRMSGPFLKGWQIFHAVVDTRGTPTLHAAAVQDAFGTNVMSGDLKGRRFLAAKTPPVPPKLLPAQVKMMRQWGISTMSRVWHVEPGPRSERKLLYAGTAPAALFRSEDGGRNWEEVRSLTNHPTRKHWTPGAGGMCLHSIQVDPENSRRMYVGISSPGAFRTDDGGKSWKPINRGVAMFPEAPKGLGIGT
ncbi:MAG: hypothetical protein L0216_13065 [Planctomycetales bacterium]|nr:hypothetical protein [Planctomycetales bacterium]